MTVLTDHLLTVTDLVHRPGASRRVDLTLPAPEGLDLPLASVEGPLRLDGVLESVVDGLLVRGTVRTVLRLACARCLVDVDEAVEVAVIELFADPADPDLADVVEAGYELREGHLHVGTLLRDALAAAVPLRPLCTPGCAGLCPTCGANRNEVQCACREDVVDPRWEALRGLRLDERPH